MLYRQVHVTREQQLMDRLRRKIKAACKEYGDYVGNWINVGCMMPWMNYTPRTLDELVGLDQQYDRETD